MSLTPQVTSFRALWKAFTSLWLFQWGVFVEQLYLQNLWVILLDVSGTQLSISENCVRKQKCRALPSWLLGIFLWECDCFGEVTSKLVHSICSAYYQVRFNFTWALLLLLFQGLVFRETVRAGKKCHLPQLGEHLGSLWKCYFIWDVKGESDVARRGEVWDVCFGQAQGSEGRSRCWRFREGSAVENDHCPWHCCDSKEELNQFIHNIKHQQWKNLVK